MYIVFFVLWILSVFFLCFFMVCDKCHDNFKKLEYSFFPEFLLLCWLYWKQLQECVPNSLYGDTHDTSVSSDFEALLFCIWSSARSTIYVLVVVGCGRGGWPISQPQRAEAFSKPSAQPVSTQWCACVCVCVSARGRGVRICTHVHMRLLWAVFV